MYHFRYIVTGTDHRSDLVPSLYENNGKTNYFYTFIQKRNCFSLYLFKRCRNIPGERRSGYFSKKGRKKQARDSIWSALPSLCAKTNTRGGQSH